MARSCPSKPPSSLAGARVGPQWPARDPRITAAKYRQIPPTRPRPSHIPWWQWHRTEGSGTLPSAPVRAFAGECPAADRGMNQPRPRLTARPSTETPMGPAEPARAGHSAHWLTLAWPAVRRAARQRGGPGITPGPPRSSSRSQAWPPVRSANGPSPRPPRGTPPIRRSPRPRRPPWERSRPPA